MKHACKEISRLASDSLDRKLNFSERFRFRMHLLICSNCRNCDNTLRLIHDVSELIRRTNYGNIRLSDNQRQQLHQALKDNTGS